MVQIIFAGFPQSTTLSGYVPLTTDPAPIITLSPIHVPGRIIERKPIKQLLPIVIGFKNLPLKERTGTDGDEKGFVGE